MELNSNDQTLQPKELAPKIRKHGSQFLLQLFDFLEENSSPEIISWDDDGWAIKISDQLKLEKNVLSKLYKHTNLDLFFKQLNTYNFRRKLVNQKDIVIYHHPKFLRGRSDLIKKIKRASLILENKDIQSKKPTSSRKRLLKVSPFTETQIHSTIGIPQASTVEFNERSRPENNPESDQTWNSLEASLLTSRINNVSGTNVLTTLDINEIISVLFSSNNQIFSALLSEELGRKEEDF